MLRRAILGISVGVVLTFGAENAGGQTLTKADLAKPLSPEATKVVVRHLTQVVDLLLHGGPSPRLSDEEKADWTVDKELSSAKEMPTDEPKREYLDQYRSAFLRQWTWQIRDWCSPGKDGGLDISDAMGRVTCCFQPSGTTRGHYDAQGQASWLFLSVGKERFARFFARLESSGNASKEGIESVDPFRYPGERTEPLIVKHDGPLAHHEAIAFLYLYAVAGDEDSSISNKPFLELPITDSEVATAHHLCQVVRFLHTGMKHRGFSETQEKWTLERELESHDIEPTNADTREYLNDYRRMFLTTWLDKLQNSSTWVDNYRFQSAGTANGFYAAQHLARNVRSVRGAPVASPSPIRYAPRAAIGSLRYLRANFSAEPETTGAPSGADEDSAE